MVDRPTNTIIREPEGGWSKNDPEFQVNKADILEQFPWILGMAATDEELDEMVRNLIAGGGLPATRMGVVLGYEMEPGRMMPGSSLTGGQPYQLSDEGREWRSADVLNYVRDLWSMPGQEDFRKLAQGLLIEGFIDDIDEADDLYELDTVIDGIGAAISDVSTRAKEFGLTEHGFTKDSGMDYVPTLEGRFADTDFNSFEEMLDNIILGATEMPDPDYLRELFDTTSKQKAGYSVRKGNPGGYKQWLQGYRAAKQEKTERGEEMNPGAYAATGVGEIAPEAVAMQSRKKYVAYANMLLSDYEGVSQ